MPSPREWIDSVRAIGPFASEDVASVQVPSMGKHPSYRYKLEEAKRVRRMVREQFGVFDPVRDINDKWKGYVFADRHGIDHPRLYGEYQIIDQVVWDALPDQFVLKSRFGSSNRGVKALVRQPDGSYWDLLRSVPWTVEGIVANQMTLEQEGKASASLFAEELILKGDDGEVADDWKFYCFDGRVALSMQRDLRGSADSADWRFQFRDRQWQDLGPIKFADRIASELAGPRHPEALVEVAERLSTLIGLPFMRIDLFESDRGPLLGEFTPSPGPPEFFTPEIDAMLGAYWEQSLARLHARSVRQGAWDHLAVSSSGAIGEVAENVEVGVVGASEVTASAVETETLYRQVEALTGAVQWERSRHRKAVQRIEQLSDECAMLRAELGEERQLINELGRLESDIARLKAQRERLRYRVAERDWKLASLRSRRWWQLGQILNAVRKHPTTALTLPVNIYRLITRQPVPILRPERPQALIE